MAKLMEIARVKVEDKKTAKQINLAKQKARAVETAEDRIVKISRFAHECIAADKPAVVRESWIVRALVDLLSGASYSPREHEILARALANVRREIAVQSAGCAD
jgi:hypothetical protein